MHGESMQEVKTLKASAGSHLRHWTVFLGALVSSALAVASMTIVTLSELIKESEIIVYGQVQPGIAGISGSSPGRNSFKVISALKGNAFRKGDEILLCNERLSSEWPDLAKLVGPQVLFISRKGNCFELSHGYKSIVSVNNGRASTNGVKGEPLDEPVESFFRKVRSMATKHRGDLSSVSK